MSRADFLYGKYSRNITKTYQSSNYRFIPPSSFSPQSIISCSISPQQQQTYNDNYRGIHYRGFISHLRAQPFEHPLFTPLAQIWGTQNAGGTPSPERTYAEDVILQIKRALKDQTKDATEIEHASESFPDWGSQTLRALFASVWLPDLLNNLLDSSHSYGQPFHKECEILWHDFGTQNQDERLRIDFLWVRAEYIQIKDKLKVTRGEYIIVTGLIRH